MKTLTWADFAKHEPCYNPAEKYGKWEGTILDLMQHANIPAKDKIWAFTREGVVDDKTLRLFAVGCARRAQHLMTDERSINALDVAERYANGEATEDELYAAWAAARAAARDAARAAARAAAWDAAWAAAEAAAEAAASDMARAAARAAEGDAAEAAASDMARAAAWNGAWDGAWNAARAAARAAEGDAAEAAASDMARAAAWNGAWETERKAQVEIAVELLTKLK